ncbi:uncharacterized protein LOC133514790 isoform X1 [Syngnathoides biaculeatus]|uniref:uncharacterized protein LOC133514790 isoform X1 n=1 Tax=Syngnathoides biaculeatus TaxID=300417 RepID=UPI002ADD84D5|nr:uncharacterized protein LOC133514790 isoform X1 [Syngnathoides biaculeatus]
MVRRSRTIPSCRRLTLSARHLVVFLSSSAGPRKSRCFAVVFVGRGPAPFPLPRCGFLFVDASATEESVHVGRAGGRKSASDGERLRSSRTRSGHVRLGPCLGRFLPCASLAAFRDGRLRRAEGLSPVFAFGLGPHLSFFLESSSSFVVFLVVTARFFLHLVFVIFFFTASFFFLFSVITVAPHLFPSSRGDRVRRRRRRRCDFRVRPVRHVVSLRRFGGRVSSGDDVCCHFGVRRGPGVDLSALQGRRPTCSFHPGSEQHRRLHPIGSLQTRLPTVTPSDRGSRRSSRSDVEPTESESNHSYQNNCEEQDLSESSSGDYLIVLPEDEPPATDGSGASTPSSGEAHDYENIREASPKDDRDYLNVSPLPPGEETPTLSSQSDDSDGEGKYVNEGSVMTSA